MLEFNLFGPPQITLNNAPIKGLPSRAAEAILIYLACQKKPVNREYMSELLWSDRTPKQASANLRSILSSLRKAVGDHIIVTRQTLAFNQELPFFVDVLDFEAKFSEIENSGIGLPPTGKSSLPHLKKIMGLYEGEFLEGYYLRDGRGFDDWATLTRERLRRQAFLGMRQLLRHYVETGNYEAGIDEAERLISIDPYDEDTRRQLMLLFVRSGQRNAALRQFESLRQKLKDDLNVDPSPSTQALHDRLRDLSSPPPHVFPASPSPIIGREDEITALRKMLRDRNNRLITLFGSGGIGKTRLGMEVTRTIASHRPGEFLDGIFFVSLASINAPQYLAATIARVIGVQLQGSAPVPEQLLEYVRNREMLLVLDNYEQLLGDSSAAGVSLLVSILATAPDVKLLVTSRERLNLYEEIVFDVTGLAVPEEDAPDLNEDGAAALFRQTARRHKRDISFDGENGALVVRVCRLLQGVPLAIELASSWVRQYTSAQIVAQIEANLDFLQTRFHNMPKRHRSLRAVFNHSWDLLSPQEQAVFCQIPVFQGGFTKDAFEAVISLDSMVFDRSVKNKTQEFANEWIFAFADKSLLQMQDNDHFEMHPLVRQFASEKQAEFTGVLNVIPQKHADYYFDFVIRQESGEQPDQRAGLIAELANIRAAWAWAVQTGDFKSLDTVTPILQNFFSIQSWFQEGIEMFSEAALQMEPLADAPEKAAVLSAILGREARMHTQIGQIDAARKTLQKAQRYLDKVPSRDARSKILDSLAITYFYAGDYEEAAGIAEEILNYAEETKNLEALGFATGFWGSCAKALGDYDLALKLFERGASTYEEMNDRTGVAMMYNNLGNLEQARNDFSAARGFYHQSTRIFKEVDHIHGAATTLANEGKLALHEGDYEDATELLNESVALKRELNDERGMAVAIVSLGDLYAEIGEYSKASAHLHESLTLANKTGDVRLVFEILVAVVEFWVIVGQNDRAAPLLAFALNHPALTHEAKMRGDRLLEKVEKVDPKESDLEEIVERVLAQLSND